MENHQENKLLVTKPIRSCERLEEKKEKYNEESYKVDSPVKGVTNLKVKSIIKNTHQLKSNKDINQPKSIKNTTKNVKKKSNNEKVRKVCDMEKPEKVQTTITQHFQVRRSERKVKTMAKNDAKLNLEKIILSGIEDGLEVRLIEEKGRGVFTKQSLKKGDLVCEYAGDLISLKEALQREKDYEKNPELGCYMYFFDYKDKKYCVDATKETGRLGRLLNHSKTNSNVCTKLFPIGNTPHLILVAQKDIACDQELLYDYGDRSKRSIESHPWLKL
ncbi:N-lysine methyltransferase KMT5A-A isoform X4 [Hydra vulgaris]|uniref:[histone H4]-lysine(20) N-methyltransferase n=1 Tax=Hydra vulgaris TaxID=6087 RepID=A0ABM4D8E5_HYDVU